MGRILVTGGAGFIGSNFIQHLLSSKNDAVVNLDKLTYAANLKNLDSVKNNPNYTFIQGDICDESVVKSVMKNVDVVINFAAETHVDRSIKNAQPFINTDINGTFVLLEAAKHAHVSRFIQISTDEVYGSIQQGKFVETDMLNPSNPYSASKASAELIARSYFKTYKLPVIVVRPCNNFGPHQYPEKIIPYFISLLMQNKKVPVYGDGLQIRDWMYVTDTCRAIERVMEKGIPGEIYNISSYNEITNLELTKKLLSNLHKPHDMIDFVEDRKGHDRRYAIDSTKIRSLGWSPQVTFEEGITKTISWYTQNSQWWTKKTT